jgi:hypothetical protein
VDRDDIELLALTGGQMPYAALKLSELNRGEHEPSDAKELASSLRQYLYEKYVFRSGSEAPQVAVQEPPPRMAAAGGHHD